LETVVVQGIGCFIVDILAVQKVTGARDVNDLVASLFQRRFTGGVLQRQNREHAQATSPFHL
jgi:hypothetical protein